ncbi:YcaO-like family protein [Kineococcus sp. NPDC059986]|uniref:YcaO-like family protein n=1 Tax=Kineococcus sp. NPDC059986 TaxID=3155538 RepID=UPI003450F9F0
MTGADAHATADRYAAALGADAGAELLEFDLTGFDRTGIPVTGTVWRPFPGAPSSGHGVGYGADPAAARRGAYGELAEQVLLDRHLQTVRPVEATHAELLAARGPGGVVDPVELVLPAGSRYTPDLPLRWLPTRRWRTGEEVLVPAEFVAPHAGGVRGGPPPGGFLTTPVTNGVGAGDTLERAVAHGLGELLQRDGDTVSFRALEEGVLVGGVAEHPATAGVWAALAAAGLEPQVKLDSTEFAVVVHAVARDTDPDRAPMAVTAVGEAAAPDAPTAARKALLELGSSRARRVFAFGPLDPVRALGPYWAAEERSPLPESEARALRAMADWTHRSGTELARLVEPLLRVTDHVRLADLPTAPAREPVDELTDLLDRLAGFDVLVHAVAVTTSRGPVHVVKVVVPGLEVETLSYHRIGERVLRRLLDRGSPLVGLGPSSGSRRPVLLTDAARERVGGPAWFDVDVADATVGELYPLYREPVRHAPQRLEL